MSAVPKKLQAALQRRDLTVTDAANLIGMSRPVFSFIVHGHYTLSVATAFKIEAALGLSARRMLREQLHEEIDQHLSQEGAT